LKQERKLNLFVKNLITIFVVRLRAIVNAGAIQRTNNQRYWICL